MKVNWIQRLVSGVLALSIFWESCARYEFASPESLPEDAERARASLRLARRVAALPLSDEDKDYWKGLNLLLNKGCESPESAQEMLDAGGVQDDATGVYIALDDYSRRILQVFTNQALHEAVQRRDYPAVAKILSQHRRELEPTAEVKARLDRLLEQMPELQKMANEEFEPICDCVVVIPVVVFAGAVVLVVVVAGVTLAAGAFAFVGAYGEVKVQAPIQPWLDGLRGADLHMDTLAILAKVDSLEAQYSLQRNLLEEQVEEALSVVGSLRPEPLTATEEQAIRQSLVKLFAYLGI